MHFTKMRKLAALTSVFLRKCGFFQQYLGTHTIRTKVVKICTMTTMNECFVVGTCFSLNRSMHSRHWTGSRLSWSGSGEAYRRWQCICASSSHTALCICSDGGENNLEQQ